jgi:peroxiredoxin
MSLEKTPENLPIPEDDGACDHLTGMKFPDIELSCTDGKNVNISKQSGKIVIYIYPMTGRPNVALPKGWDSIPGARGCTPQSCSFRDLHDDLKEHAQIFGLSSQDTDYQKEARIRLQLPFELLSDSTFSLKKLLSLPTFTSEDIERYKRVTLIMQDNVIKKVFYPVFPPDQNARDVLAWLTEND